MDIHRIKVGNYFYFRPDNFTKFVCKDMPGVTLTVDYSKRNVEICFGIVRKHTSSYTEVELMQTDKNFLVNSVTYKIFKTSKLFVTII